MADYVFSGNGEKIRERGVAFVAAVAVDVFTAAFFFIPIYIDIVISIAFFVTGAGFVSINLFDLGPDMFN